MLTENNSLEDALLLRDNIKQAKGCFMGQCVGDSLGALVEFSSPEDIRRKYPQGMQFLEDGGHWNLIAGQPTDDTEMALSLARSIINEREYNPAKAKQAYVDWLDSNPFDAGATVTGSLMNPGNERSQASEANGALMRVSPLAIFGAGKPSEQVGEWAMQDAAITHPNRICQEVNALFAMAIAYSMTGGPEIEDIYSKIIDWCKDLNVHDKVLRCVEDSCIKLPDTMKYPGHVLVAFQIALYHLLNTEHTSKAIIDTVQMGGDTDTNGAICGAMMGAINGINLIPFQWKRAVRECNPIDLTPTHHPRPEQFWPCDVEDLATQLFFM